MGKLLLRILPKKQYKYKYYLCGRILISSKRFRSIKNRTISKKCRIDYIKYIKNSNTMLENIPEYIPMEYYKRYCNYIYIVCSVCMQDLNDDIYCLCKINYTAEADINSTTEADINSTTEADINSTAEVDMNIEIENLTNYFKECEINIINVLD